MKSVADSPAARAKKVGTNIQNLDFFFKPKNRNS